MSRVLKSLMIVLLSFCTLNDERTPGNFNILLCSLGNIKHWKAKAPRIRDWEANWVRHLVCIPVQQMRFFSFFPQALMGGMVEFKAMKQATNWVTHGVLSVCIPVSHIVRQPPPEARVNKGLYNNEFKAKTQPDNCKPHLIFLFLCYKGVISFLDTRLKGRRDKIQG